MKSLMPFIIIIVCIGMYFVYVNPATQEVRSLVMEKSGYENILNKTRELKTQRENLLTEYNTIDSNDIDRLNKIVPETFSSILFLNDLTAQVSLFGMVVKDFTTNEPKSENRSVLLNENNNSYKTTMVRFNVIGSYSQFVRFLNSLESSLRLVDVVGISIRPVAGVRTTTGESILEYSLELKTYSLR